MKKYHYILIISLFPLFLKVEANPTISFFFKPFTDIKAISNKLKKPGNLAHHTVHGIVNHTSVSGILSIYAGYIDSSDYNGEVVFPRKHSKPAVVFLVTPELKPIALFENTIDHWELIPGMPAAMYVCEQKYDAKKQSHYWETKEVLLPADNIIPLTSVIIIAKPKNISIPIGVSPTRDTANLVLPDVFVMKGINIVANDSYMLTIRHLFKPVDSLIKREPLKVLTQVID